tara:strand:+ start:1124 stop:1318 length:195 start_codon:yes stop_codon:yes gene_type:complete
MATTDIITALDTVITDKIAGEIDDRELLSRSEIEDFIQSELDYRLEDMVIEIITNRLSFDVSVT